jgi:hypothetical protein
MNRRMQLIAQKFNATLCRVIAALLLIGASAATCAADGSVANLPQISRQLQRLKADEAAEKRRIDSDEKLIQELERRLEQVDARDRSLAGATEKLTTTNNQVKEQTDQKLQTLESRLDSGSPSSVFDSAMGRYFGQHQFTFAGAAAGAFTYDRQSAQNSFALVFEPLVLYKLNDWILFEAEIEASRAAPALTSACRSRPRRSSSMTISRLTPENSINPSAIGTRPTAPCGLIGSLPLPCPMVRKPSCRRRT